MTKQEFDRLSEKYKAGQCSHDEIALLEQWAALHLRQQDRMIVNELELLKIEAPLWNRIQASTGLLEAGKPRFTWLTILTGVAAGLSLLLLAWVLLPDTPVRQDEEVSIVGVQTKNTGNMQQTVQLADGSTVLLEPGASVVADENYGQQTRTVRLEGEAFFDIQSNPEMPFLVFTGDLVTEVLGTSFRIKPRAGQKTIEVSVVTGKVSVYAGGGSRKKDGVIITPNQKVVYDTELKTIRQDLVDLPKVVVPDPQKLDFSFDEIRVDSVFSVMHRTYGVDIVVGNPGLNRCVFTGDLSGLDMYRQLDFICEVINAAYEIRGAAIFITGNGCSRVL